MACSVVVIEDSVSEIGVRITTLQLRYWRAIHSEFMTHRMFSRCASSSRAIPVKKVLQQVWNDPASPIYWGANQQGMQASKELEGVKKHLAKLLWRSAGKVACVFAWGAMKVGLHKQVANRLLEPWQYINVVVTATEWDNFFELRDHEDAQPEIRELSVSMNLAMARSTPKTLKFGEWHTPYVGVSEKSKFSKDQSIKVSAARCARTSYLTFDGRKSEWASDIALHDKLVASEPIHASPTEHQATPLKEGTMNKNFRGWDQYRTYLELGATV